MESNLTNLEMNAVFQLIQLSGDSSHDFQVFWVNFLQKKGEEVGESTEEEAKEEDEEEESVGETSLSPPSPSEEALPRRRMRLRPIVDIYKRSRPTMNLRRRKMRQ